MNLSQLRSSIQQNPVTSFLIGLCAVVAIYTLYAWSPSFPEDLPSSETKQELRFTSDEKARLETRIKTTFLRLHGELVDSKAEPQRESESLQIHQTYHLLDENKLLQAAKNLAEQKKYILRVQKASTPNLTEPIYQLKFIYQQTLRVEILVFLSADTLTPIAARIKSPGITEKPDPELTNKNAESSQAKLVIIIDDLGQNYTQFVKIAALEENFTFSILPELPYSKQTIAKARELGLEIMLHIPMQPQGWPKINPGKSALLVDTELAMNKSILEMQLHQNSTARGANNHMGSAFTQSVKGMEMVMEALSLKDMFFLDSKTASGQISKNAAKRFGVPFLQRDYFLDNERNVTKIQAQIQKAGKLALKRGWAVAICHPYPATYKALKLELETLKRQGITITRASQIIEDL